MADYSKRYLCLMLVARAALGAGEERFYGGGRDGYDRAGASAVPAAARAGWYLGGARDGHSSAMFAQIPFLARQGWYLGGLRDGAALALYLATGETAGRAWFTGGARDGQASVFLADQVNPLDRDSDGDGLPDWWELAYFDWITNASPRAHSDGDGLDDGSEFTADTDPLDAHSYFHLFMLQHESPWAIAFTCSPARVYTLQTTDDLKTGAWQNVEGMIQQPGEADGRMTISVGNATGCGFFRIEVELPP